MRAEVAALLGELHGVESWMASLLYGGGLRLLECCRLRVKDIDLGGHELIVREAKGDRDRRTLLPDALHPALERQLREGRQRHAAEVAAGDGGVELPTPTC